METLEQGNSRKRRTEVADLRVKAVILSRRNTRQDKRALVQIWKEIGARQPLSPAEQFELARLYESIDDWPRAREILQSLLVDGRANNLLLTHYVQSLIHHNELDEATTWLIELESLAPDSFAVTALKARSLAAGRRPPGRGAYPGIPSGKSGDHDMTAAATLLNELGHPKIAEGVLRDREESLDADARLAFVTLIARDGRIDEALELCEQARPVLPMLAIAQMSVTVLRTSAPTTAQIERVKSWLRKWLEADPDSTVLLNYLANVFDLEQNYDQAESLYVCRLGPRIHQDVRGRLTLANAGISHGRSPWKEHRRAFNWSIIALRIAGPVPELLNTRAATYLALHDTQHAIRDLNNALDEKPSASTYIRLAQAYSTANNRRAARDAIQKVKDLAVTATNLHALDFKSYQELLQRLK